jgi:probable HAF family extracellular repeat protein
LLLPLTAQNATAQAKKPKHHHYKLIDTGTLGGATSSLGFEGERDINNRGTVVSLAETNIPDPTCPGCYIGHAVAWQNGVLHDLGALPPLNNSGPIWLTDSGLVAGFSENGVIDPLTGSPEFQAVLFVGGHVISLGNFGGTESIAFGVNDRAEVVGCGTTAISEPYGLCLGTPQQSRAFLWRNGVIQDLGTLGGSDALAELVNNRGQIAGWSFTDSVVNSSTGMPTQHPFLWENGTMRDLGTIGGTVVPLVNDLNSRGQIVGGMNVAGDKSFHPFLWDGTSLKDLGTFGGDWGSANWVSETGQVVGWAFTAGNQTSHAFLWHQSVLTDLGTVDGDPNSIAYGINSAGQVVGSSQDNSFNFVHAFLWERGSIADLNALIPADSGVQLNAAPGINERGEIVVQGIVLLSGNTHVFLLVPCDDDHLGIEGCDYSMVEAAEVSSDASAVRAPQSTQPRKEAIVRMMGASRNPFLRRYRLPGLRPAPSN